MPSVAIKAPVDRKSTTARLIWLLRMLPDDDKRRRIPAHRASRMAPTIKDIALLRDDPAGGRAGSPKAAPYTFEVSLVDGTGKRFGEWRTFIENLERMVPEFYDLVEADPKA